MAVFMVETYVVKPDKLGEFMEFGKKYIAWTKKRPDLFKEVKSWKLFAQVLGGNFGGYVEMWEFENLATGEKTMNTMMQDKEFMTTIYSEFASLLVPATHSINIWNSVP
jgi:hypothetical protein